MKEYNKAYKKVDGRTVYSFPTKVKSESRYISRHPECSKTYDGYVSLWDNK